MGSRCSCLSSTGFKNFRNTLQSLRWDVSLWPSVKITQGYKEREHKVNAFDLRALSLLSVHLIFSLAVFSAFTSQFAAVAAAMLLLICCTFCFACLSILHSCTNLVNAPLCYPQFVSVSKEELSVVFYYPRSLHVTHELNRCLSIVLFFCFCFLSDVGTVLHSKSSHLSCASLPMVLSSSV